MWGGVVGVCVCPGQDVMYYEQLKAGVLQHDLLVDNLIYKVLPHGAAAPPGPRRSPHTQPRLSSQDVKLTASNDDYYFVFEDFLYQVQTRDPRF